MILLIGILSVDESIDIRNISHEIRNIGVCELHKDPRRIENLRGQQENIYFISIVTFRFRL